jgi:hypothetical protein
MLEVRMPEFSRFTRSAIVLLVAPLVAWGVVQLMVGVFVSGGSVDRGGFDHLSTEETHLVGVLTEWVDSALGPGVVPRVEVSSKFCHSGEYPAASYVGVVVSVDAPAGAFDRVMQTLTLAGIRGFELGVTPQEAAFRFEDRYTVVRAGTNAEGEGYVSVWTETGCYEEDS